MSYLFPDNFTLENKIFRVIGLLVFFLSFTAILLTAYFSAYSVLTSFLLTLFADLFAGIGRKSVLFNK